MKVFIRTQTSGENEKNKDFLIFGIFPGSVFGRDPKKLYGKHVFLTYSPHSRAGSIFLVALISLANKSDIL